MHTHEREYEADSQEHAGHEHHGELRAAGELHDPEHRADHEGHTADGGDEEPDLLEVTRR